jgi:endonuclease/exonuclease/phosphatase family metal-dependent hydrolase
LRLRVATFNLENLDDRPGLDPPLATRIDVLRPQLLRLAADILCLQEVHGQKRGRSARALLALEVLLAGTPYADFALASTRSPGRRGAAGWVADVHNLVVLSRWPILRQDEIRGRLVAPPTHHPIATPGEPQPVLWDRPLLHVTVALPDGSRLEVINLHLRAPLATALPGQKEAAFSWRTVPAWAEGFFLSTVKRAGQALEARLLVDRLLDDDPHARIVVAGDLNAEDREMPVRLLAAETTDTGNGALAARSLMPVARSLPQDQRFTVVHAGRRLMLDHILISRALLGGLRSVAAHNETVADEAHAVAGILHPTESSHAPLVAELELGPPSGPADRVVRCADEIGADGVGGRES